jgi:hypothetical protein
MVQQMRKIHFNNPMQAFLQVRRPASKQDMDAAALPDDRRATSTLLRVASEAGQI